MKISALALFCLSTLTVVQGKRNLQGKKAPKKTKKPKKPKKETVLTPSADYQDHYLVSKGAENHSTVIVGYFTLVFIVFNNHLSYLYLAYICMITTLVTELGSKQ